MISMTTDIDERKDEFRLALANEPAASRTFWEKLDLSWVFHEFALEGNVLTSEEMREAFSTEPGPMTGVQAALIAEIRRQRQANDIAKTEAQDPKGKLSLALMKRLYTALTGRDGELPFRREVPAHRAYFHDIVPPAKIVAELTKLFEFANKAELLDQPPLQQAAVFHHRFMAVFPFEDVSGKVGRLLSNILLMRAGYLPAVIHSKDRQRYYQSLEQAPHVLQGIVTEAVQRATEHGLKWFADIEAARRPPPPKVVPAAKAKVAKYARSSSRKPAARKQPSRRGRSTRRARSA